MFFVKIDKTSVHNPPKGHVFFRETGAYLFRETNTHLLVQALEASLQVQRKAVRLGGEVPLPGGEVSGVSRCQCPVGHWGGLV